MNDKKETVTEYTDTTIEDYVAKIHQQKAKILEDFTRAYLGELQLMPSEVELVQRETRDGNIIETIFEFRKKTGDHND